MSLVGFPIEPICLQAPLLLPPQSLSKARSQKRNLWVWKNQFAEFALFERPFLQLHALFCLIQHIEQNPQPLLPSLLALLGPQ